MKIVKKKISDLIFSEYNPRKLTDKEEQDLTDSIKRFGIVDPIIINKHPDRKDIVVGGHQRIRIALKLEYKEIPCVEVEMDRDRERELNIRLNKNNGSWDWDLLEDNFELEELVDWGFDEDELDFDIEVKGEIEDDEIPEVEEAICKKGDLWQLGDHRLLCGDATDKSDVDRLMGGEKADMVFTDPPYGIDYNVSISNNKGQKGNWKHKPKEFAPVIGDDKKYNPKHIFDLFGYCKEIFLWGADYYSERLINKNDGSWIVWDKRAGIEDIKLTFSEFELCWSKNGHPREIARVRWTGLLGTEQEFDHNQGRQHPTQKPIKLAEWFINKFSNKDNLVIDLFLGSGSTLIACEKTNRKCFACEIDEHYCDVIINRWEEYTGKKAEKIG